MEIDAALMRDGAVDIEAFTAAARTGRQVGVCGCGGALSGSVDRGRGLVWLTTRCGACGMERTSPGGRLASRPRDHQRVERRPAPEKWVLEAAAELEAQRFPEPGAA